MAPFHSSPRRSCGLFGTVALSIALFYAPGGIAIGSVGMINEAYTP